jgi:AraC-like DNA-binding protein
MSGTLENITDWEALARRCGYRIEAMAAHQSVTRGHLRRLFRRRFGGRLGGWLQAIRLERAKILLEQGLAIKQITGAIGFKQVSYFSQFFKEHAGITAGNYARMKRPHCTLTAIPKAWSKQASGTDSAVGGTGETMVVFVDCSAKFGSNGDSDPKGTSNVINARKT